MAIHHLVSRGVEVAQQHAHRIGHYELPGKAVFAIIATILGYTVLQAAMQYTYGLLLPTLVVTEASSTSTIIRTSQYHDDEEDENPDAPLLTKEEKEIQKPRDEEVLVIRHKPITSRFTTTIRHLKERTGSKASRFRAAGGFVVYTFVIGAATSFARNLFPFGHFILNVPIIALLCLFPTAWVQQAVAMPGKNYFQRVAELRHNGAFKKLFFPVLLVEAVELSVFTLPKNILITTSVLKNSASENNEVVFTTIGAALAVFTFLFSFTCVVIPLNIALVRLQASLLDEQTETVIPVDRSLGNAEIKSLRTAWKSFSREGCLRLIKTWIKFGVMQVALALVAITAVVIELKVLAGPQFRQMLQDARAIQQQRSETMW